MFTSQALRSLSLEWSVTVQKKLLYNKHLNKKQEKMMQKLEKFLDMENKK